MERIIQIPKTLTQKVRVFSFLKNFISKLKSNFNKYIYIKNLYGIKDKIMSIRIGTNVVAGSGANTDNKSITANSSNQIQTIGVINQNSPTNAVKTWMGTLAEYNALKNNNLIDDNTIYNVTDDNTGVDFSLKANVDLSNTSPGIDYVVEYGGNINTGFYRVYKSGWCEQGGTVTTTSTNPTNVILSKAYNNTNYLVMTTVVDSVGHQNYARPIKQKSGTNFDFWNWNESGIITQWYSYGFITSLV